MIRFPFSIAAAACVKTNKMQNFREKAAGIQYEKIWNMIYICMEIQGTTSASFAIWTV